jgi:hypothetical protein
MVPAASETLTEATGVGVTVIDAVPLFPSLVAVTTADPTASAVTTPDGETLATPEAFVDQVTTRPESGFPFTSLVVANSW